MHPRALAQLDHYLGAEKAKAWRNQAHLFCIEPLGYLDTLWCLEHASLVCTDSGGLQKEAAFFGKPVLILRDETEWKELVDGGIAELIGTNTDLLKDALTRMALKEGHSIASLFGSGQAADIICQSLIGNTAS
jgi:UDP-GlcNAc3NAcA epimerase